MDWTSDASESLAFHKTSDALSFDHVHSFGGFQFVLKFGDSRLDVVGPVEDCGSRNT